MTRLTYAAVNAALKARGFGEILVKGDGYHYFAEGDAHTWPSVSVMVTRLSDLSLDGWLCEHDDLRQARF